VVVFIFRECRPIFRYLCGFNRVKTEIQKTDLFLISIKIRLLVVEFSHILSKELVYLRSFGIALFGGCQQSENFKKIFRGELFLAAGITCVSGNRFTVQPDTGLPGHLSHYLCTRYVPDDIPFAAGGDNVGISHSHVESPVHY
jgi:hypothetical protein